MSQIAIPDADQITALAQQAADQRLPRPELHAELAASAVTLAQHLTGEIIARDLPREIRLPAADGEPFDRENRHGTKRWRDYAIKTVTWKTGRIGRRQHHQTHLLVREHFVLNWTAFWDPRNGEATWDTDQPPRLPALGGLNHDSWLVVTLADGDQLARVASDAVAIAQRLADRAEQRTSALRDGLKAADRALGLLGAR